VPPLLRIESLHKAYGGQPALVDLSLDVAGGEILGFIGPNGAGKTTTIKIVAGLAFADAGQVVVDGHRLEGHGPEARAARSALGLLPDRPYLYDKLTARESCSWPASTASRARRPSGTWRRWPRASAWATTWTGRSRA